MVLCQLHHPQTGYERQGELSRFRCFGRPPESLGSNAERGFQQDV